jgi:hypothetical protein
MHAQFLVVDRVEFNTYPTSHPDVRREKELLGLGLDQRRLQTRWHGKPRRDMPVLMMIIGQHRVDLFPHEKCWLAMREFLRGPGQRPANSSYPAELLFTGVRLRSFELPLQSSPPPLLQRAQYSIIGMRQVVSRSGNHSMWQRPPSASLPLSAVEGVRSSAARLPRQFSMKRSRMGAGRSSERNVAGITRRR